MHIHEHMCVRPREKCTELVSMCVWERKKRRERESVCFCVEVCLRGRERFPNSVEKLSNSHRIMIDQLSKSKKLKDLLTSR